jgi:hypothetical protein
MKTAKQAPEPAHGHPHQPLGLYVGMHGDVPEGCVARSGRQPKAVGAHVGHPGCWKKTSAGARRKLLGGGQLQPRLQRKRKRKGKQRVEDRGE